MSDVTNAPFDHLDLAAIRTRAKLLARADREMKADLVKVRREAGLTQKDVADIIGVSQQAIYKLERYDSDPKLSTLSRYANAVGALVEHSVSRDVGQSQWEATQLRWAGNAVARRASIAVGAESRMPSPQGPWSVTGRGHFALAA